jgi:hypothetical protein
LLLLLLPQERAARATSPQTFKRSFMGRIFGLTGAERNQRRVNCALQILC